MDSVNLLQKYPNLIEKCREFDCSYKEAIRRIEEAKGSASSSPSVGGVEGTTSPPQPPFNDGTLLPFVSADYVSHLGANNGSTKNGTRQ